MALTKAKANKLFLEANSFNIVEEQGLITNVSENLLIQHFWDYETSLLSSSYKIINSRRSLANTAKCVENKALSFPQPSTAQYICAFAEVTLTLSYL